MYQRLLRLTIATITIFCASLPTSAPAQAPATQLKLTEQHLEGFIAIQKDMSMIVEKMMQANVFSKSANTKYEAELKAVTKKQGI